MLQIPRYSGDQYWIYKIVLKNYGYREKGFDRQVNVLIKVGKNQCIEHKYNALML